MGKIQTKILNALQKSDARLQSSEGVNYKTWLVYPNGTTETVRRDVAESFCDKYERNLVFGQHDGIRWRR